MPVPTPVYGNYKSETLRESVLHLALVAIARDEKLKCRCGSEDYNDGDPCPRCTAHIALLSIYEDCKRPENPDA